MIYSLDLKTINVLMFSVAAFWLYPQLMSAEAIAQSVSGNKTIRGQSGGTIDSQGCGFIAARPNYQMNLAQRVDYMRLTVQTDGGQPTLLVLGPNPGDSFCVLGDEVSGLKPEISGVWEAGNYQVYIGDRTGRQHPFVLDIATDN